MKAMEGLRDFQRVSFSVISNFRDTILKYLPTIVMWSLRIMLTFQAYMYHSSIGLFHLSWVITTFLFSDRVSLAITVLVMLPMYLWEFITVYSMKTLWLKDQPKFKESSRFFVQKMAQPLLEQTLYYFILINLSFCVSCLFLSFQYD
jgi:hypothetical protein